MRKAIVMKYNIPSSEAEEIFGTLFDSYKVTNYRYFGCSYVYDILVHNHELKYLTDAAMKIWHSEGEL